ncbi:MAG: hypothetical protein ACERKJ_10645 [Candidatus Dadabacteria bacterium]
MKNLKISCILSLIIVMTMLSCTTQPPVEQQTNPLEGVWEFVSGEQTTQDTIITYPGPQSTDIRSFKFITGEHWGVTGMVPSQEMNWGFAGTYRVTDDTYVEYFVIQINPENIGDSAVYKYKLDGDKWTISSDRLKEEWKRIE